MAKTIVWANGRIGREARVEGAVLGRQCHVGRAAIVGPGAVLGDKSVVTDYSRTGAEGLRGLGG